MTLGERIKKIRQDAGLLQKKFGELIGLDANTVSGYETNRDKPGVGRLYLISEKFGVNPEWLIDGTGEPYKVKAISAEDRAAIEREHIRRLFSELSPKTQRAVIDALKDMIEKDAVERSVRNSIEISGTVNGDVSINSEGEK